MLTGAALLLVASGGFLYGVLVGRFKYPPFRLAESFHEKFIKSDEQKARERRAEARFHEPSPDQSLNDIPSLIAIHNEADVDAKRQRLVETIWGGRGYPRERMPDAVVPNVSDEAFAGLTNLAALDRLTVEMDYGINSVAYHFRPASANNKLVIYHAGHAEDLAAARRQIAYFVGRGYAVVALAMPLEGMNSRPVIEVEGVGRMRLNSHAQLAYLDAPLRFFAEPVVAALNYAERNHRYDLVAMAGLSGGGWTTTLCAALDGRIARSYHAAGSFPETLRDPWLEWGDFEQHTPELYRAANTLELYVLGAHGPGRRQTQILNQFDNCCFYGLRHAAYEPHVRARLAQLGGGSFSVLLDTTHRRHLLSDFALGEIARDLEN